MTLLTDNSSEELGRSAVGVRLHVLLSMQGTSTTPPVGEHSQLMVPLLMHDVSN